MENLIYWFTGAAVAFLILFTVTIVRKFVKFIWANFATVACMGMVGIFGLNIAVFFGLIGFRIYQCKMWQARVEDRILAAVKSNESEKSRKYLNDAIEYIENRGADNCYSSIMFDTPDEDMREFVAILKSASESCDGLIFDVKDSYGYTTKKCWKDKMKMDLHRNDVLSFSWGEPQVRTPAGSSIAPYNALVFWTFLASIAIGLLSFIVVIGLVAEQPSSSDRWITVDKIIVG